MVLLQVYSSADVRTALPHDANRFAVANRDFRLLMRATEKNPNVLQCCSRKSNHIFFVSLFRANMSFTVIFKVKALL